MKEAKAIERPSVTCRYVCGSLVAITAVTSALPVTAAANTSSVNFDMRKQVVNLAGILNMTDYTGQMTRGNSARMLASAFDHRENLPPSSMSVFTDAPGIYPDAVYIRVVASQGWMTGFLGGLFKPEEHIAYKDAVKAALTMLGYSDGDFTGDLVSSRISKFNYLELDGEMSRQPEEVLSQADYMNLFYNLLKTEKKDSGEIYGAVLDCELDSDGEINPITILNDERKGPIPVHKGFSVIQSVPFESENANVFLNGTTSTLETVKASQQDTGFATVYYNVKPKTIRTYATKGWDDDDLEGNNACVPLKGEVKNIYYKSTGVVTPTSIRLEIDDDNSDGDSGEDKASEDAYLTINLNFSRPQYLLSIYGGIEVGDEVVMACNENGSSYTAVDAIEY